MKYSDIKKLSGSILCLAAILGLSGCKADEGQTLEQRNWQLVWSDEFDGPAGASPDPSKWAFDIGTGDNGWGNQELQYYTDRPENAALDGAGFLVITARSETFAGAPFTSARIKTQELFSQAYGRFEARIKTPYGPGIWPAFWLLGADIETTGWPLCGEIDIMELRGQEPNIINGTVHGPGYSGGAAITQSFGFTDKRFDTDYHLFAVEWTESSIDFFVDDVLYQRITPGDLTGEWVYDAPFFIILNVAVGGNYVGFPVPQTPFPQTMSVDYVRVYR
ncbi:MAG: glycoside hydrolase family 16 protein [Lewinellaceae bacterium]|nr:glycoside hydrolase family 16 protein [Saprospiraceae bacterium]MCB9305080.1 glycoside hydrolase family 16 protein [Lewinellaceae bacterium]MCB9353358.1 glycoside hydrolase family 16 protein [Lewinellaceae bacterium]